MEILIALVIGAGVLVVALLAMLVIIAKFRVVPETDEAVVITGTTVKHKELDEAGKPTGEIKQKPKVVVGGGAYVIPIWHKYKIVSLEVVQIPIQWEGGQGKTLPSKDRIPVVLEGELSVMVDGSNEDQIILASQKLGIPKPGKRFAKGKEFSMREAVKQKADKLVQAALRTAVFEYEFVELNGKKEEFENRVQVLLQKDLARFGLTLTAVSIPHVAQGQFGDSAGDMFDEQGKRKVAEIVEHAQTQKNDIEQENRIARARRDREAKEEELIIQREVKEKEADQTREVAAYEANQSRQQTEAVLKEQQAEEEAQASQERAIAEAKAKEAEAAEKAEISKLEAVAIRQADAGAKQKAAQETAAGDIAKAEASRKVVEEKAAQQKREAEIAKNKAVEAAEIAKMREIEAAQIEKNKTIEVAEQERQQAVETAEVGRQKAVATVKAEEAAARAMQADAEAKQKEAEESIITVKETAEADRRKKVVVIKAEEEAEKDRIDADKVAYVEAMHAEGEAEAAKKRAEAVKAKATGEADATRATAAGYADDVTTRAEADFKASDKQAEAKIRLAAATLKQGEADAEAAKLMVEAKNFVADKLLIRDVTVELIKQAPSIVREVMYPVGQVAHDVKVLQINGLDGASEGSGDSTAKTILGTGMALTGALPLIREALKGFTADEDVQDIAETVAGVAKAALRETAASVKEGITGAPDKGSTEIVRK